MVSRLGATSVLLLSSVLVAATSARAASAKAEEVSAGSMLEWQEADIGKTFRIGDISLSMTPLDDADDTRIVIVYASEIGRQGVSFEFDASYNPSGTLGLVRLQPGKDDYQLVFTNFNGNCCTEVRIVDFAGKVAGLTELGSFATPYVAPTDIDGDGFSELAMPDDRFRIFDAEAANFPPDRIVGFLDGAARDVTGEPRFASYHEKLYEEQAKTCDGKLARNAGACAGLLGTAATLGVFEETLQQIDLSGSEEPTPFSPFRICAGKLCAKPKEIPLLKDALFEALQVWGYLPEAAKP